jgi:hypothetical protein
MHRSGQELYHFNLRDTATIFAMFQTKFCRVMHLNSGFKLLLFLSLLSVTASAQDTLPYFSARSMKNKVIVSWKNTYGARITNINIQRSADSLRNFTSIGSVLEPNNQENGYVDTKAPDFNQYYRIFVSFAGGTYLYTKSKRPSADTFSAIAHLPVTEEETPGHAPQSRVFVPSKLVYTSGKEKNVHINLPRAEEKRYSIRFFDEKQLPLFSIDRISETLLIIEKVNFLRSGWYYFELFEEGKLLEKNKLYIPKEGKYGIPPGEYNKRFK